MRPRTYQTTCEKRDTLFKQVQGEAFPTAEELENLSQNRKTQLWWHAPCVAAAIANNMINVGMGLADCLDGGSCESLISAIVGAVGDAMSSLTPWNCFKMVAEFAMTLAIM